MSLTVEAAKVTLEGVIIKTQKSIEREPLVRKELQDDRAALLYVEQLQSNGDPLPDNCPYLSFTEWKEQLEKEIKVSQNSIDRIYVEKAELMALNYFVDNAPEA